MPSAFAPPRSCQAALNSSVVVAGTVQGSVYFGSDKNLNDILNTLPTAKDAPSNAFARQYDPICLHDTRVALLQEIYNWGDGRDGRCIFWLNGLAGTGKSTVARTVAAKYSAKKTLGASFFFSRDGGEDGHLRYAARFVTSIAVQLANNVQPVKRAICDAIVEHSDIASRALREQWRHLILSPLSKLADSSSQSRYILVVDALDECEDENDIRIILQLLAEARSLETVQLRVFLTSRPEVPIRNGFIRMPDGEHQDFVLHNILPSIVDHDIRVFLEHSLKFIAQEQFIAAGWPGEHTIKRLVQNASGLFIWAATACRFIREGKKFAAKRLDMILEHSSTASNAPEKHLNEIYSTVLHHSISPDYTDDEVEELQSMLKSLLGSIVTLLSPLSIQSLSKLLGMSQVEVYQTLNDLHAILDIPEDQTHPLRIHHPSFRDFLLDERRCADPKICVDEKQVHQNLATKCIQLMSTSLRQDICGLDAPGVLVTDMGRNVVEQCLPPEVQYACLHWIWHLQKGGSTFHNNDQVHRFLQEHFLHWLEALGWIQKFSEAIRGISSLESIVLASRCPDLQAFVHDMKRFALYSRPAIEQAPLQAYYSALVFAPTKSMVRRQYKKWVSQCMQRLPNVEKNWSALLQTLEGHSNSVNAVAFSPNGKLLASASGDETVKLWDVGSGAAVQTFTGHSDWVCAVAFSPDGKLLASASSDETVRLWDTSLGTALQTLETHSLSVDAVAFSPDGKLLASASSDKTVRLWDASSGAALRTVEGHSDGVRAVAFSADGKLLASASNDQTIRLWDAGSGVALRTLKGHSSYVLDVAFSPDGQLLASASSDGTVRLWDAGSGATLQILKSYSSFVCAVAFSPDGKLLASAPGDLFSMGKSIELWDADSGVALQTLEGHSCYVNAVAFSPDGRLLASASGDGTVRMWDAGSRAVLQMLKGHSGYINAVAFSPDGKLLASASKDGTVKLWDADSGAALWMFEGHLGQVFTVAFSPDRKLLASASADGTVRLWDTGTGAALQTLKGHLKNWASIVTFSPDGKLLASASTDGTVKLWDAGLGTAIQTLKGHSTWVNAVAFSSDGKLLASASGDETVKLWDAGSGAALQTLDHSNWVNTMTPLPDGKLLASASGNETVRLWDTGSEMSARTFDDHSNWVRAVAFSPDGKVLASASDDGTVRLWDTSSGAVLKTLNGHSDKVGAVAFTPDGKLLASASDDKTVRLWDAGEGAALQTLEVDVVVEALSFSDDGTLLQTDKGPLHIAPVSLKTVSSRRDIPRSIFVKEQWLARGMKNVLWLPSDYRPSCTAVHGTVAALGHASGRVSILELTT